MTGNSAGIGRGAVAELADHPAFTWKLKVTLLTAEKPNGSIVLKRGEELFVVADGQPIMRPGYTGPNEVFVSGAEVGNGLWPVMLCPARKAHAASWAEWSVDMPLKRQLATRMVARAQNGLTALRARQPQQPKD